MIFNERERMILLDSRHLGLIPSMRRLLEALRISRDTPSSLIPPPSMALKFTGLRVSMGAAGKMNEREEEEERCGEFRVSRRRGGSYRPWRAATRISTWSTTGRSTASSFLLTEEDDEPPLVGMVPAGPAWSVAAH
jgi:hypothetical protein